MPLKAQEGVVIWTKVGTSKPHFRRSLSNRGVRLQATCRQDDSKPDSLSGLELGLVVSGGENCGGKG